MSRLILITVIGCCLAACANSRKPDVAHSALSDAEIASAGLSLKELSDLESFFRSIYARKGAGRYRMDSSMNAEDKDLVRRGVEQSFARPSETRKIVVEGGGGVRAGLVFSPRTGRLRMVDPAAMGSHDWMIFERVDSGYRLTMIEGCVRWPLGVRTDRGAPFILSWSLPDSETKGQD